MFPNTTQRIMHNRKKQQKVPSINQKKNLAGSPTYHYLPLGIGMSVSPQIWQQFVDLVFQDDIIKRKQNFDVIMGDTFIHSTKEEHMDNLVDLFKVLHKYGLKISPQKCQFFKKIIVNMGL